MEQDLSTILTSSHLERQQALNPFKKLSEIVYEILEEAIISFQLKPGTQLNTVKIAQLLNTSRTPVTDALEQLAETGLVINSPTRKGYYVFDLSEASLHTLIEARQAIENYAAYYCACRNSEIDLKRMKILAQQFSRSIKSWDSRDFSQIDHSFHRIIIESCGNPLLQSMYDSLDRLCSYSSHRVEDFIRTEKRNSLMMRLENQHMAIYNAVALGLPDMAFDASRKHLETCLLLYIGGQKVIGD